MEFSFALLSPCGNFCLSLRSHANQGEKVFVAHSTANENWRCHWGQSLLCFDEPVWLDAWERINRKYLRFAECMPFCLTTWHTWKIDFVFVFDLHVCHWFLPFCPNADVENWTTGGKDLISVSHINVAWHVFNLILSLTLSRFYFNSSTLKGCFSGAVGGD